MPRLSTPSRRRNTKPVRVWYLLAPFLDTPEGRTIHEIEAALSHVIPTHLAARFYRIQRARQRQARPGAFARPWQRRTEWGAEYHARLGRREWIRSLLKRHCARGVVERLTDAPDGIWRYRRVAGSYVRPWASVSSPAP